MRPRKVGDTGYPITATLYTNGVARDLTGSTVVLFLRNRTTRAIKVNGSPVTVVSPTAGTVSYQPSAADVDTEGVYDLEFRETTSGGKTNHYPSDGFEPLRLEAPIG
jgi:hypothetical protein